MTNPLTTPTRVRADDDLEARIDRLRLWAGQVPNEHRPHIAARLDQLFVRLGELGAQEDPTGGASRRIPGSQSA